MTDLTISRLWLNFNDEDYTDSVCLLLPRGQATLIDVAQFDFATQFKWQVMGRSIFHVERTPVRYVRRYCGIGRTGYGKFRIPATTRMEGLHRVLFLRGIADTTERWNASRSIADKDIDHANRNPWDSRLKNLRVATRSQNLQNTGKRRGTSSQYKGVCKIQRKNKVTWKAQATIRGKRHNIGIFDDELLAAMAYNRFVAKHCGEFAYLNPITLTPDPPS